MKFKRIKLFFSDNYNIKYKMLDTVTQIFIHIIIRSQNKKQTAFNNYKYNTHIMKHKNVTLAYIKQNMKRIDITTVTTYLSTRKINRLRQNVQSTHQKHH